MPNQGAPPQHHIQHQQAAVMPSVCVCMCVLEGLEWVGQECGSGWMERRKDQARGEGGV